MRQAGRTRERRRHSRSAISKMVPILWEDENGHETHLQGKLIDVSVSGARMWLPLKLPARAVVSFNCPALAVGGRGTVRYCNAIKDGYEVGLELSNGTGWRDQNLDLQNLAIGLDRSDQAAQRSDAPKTVPLLSAEKR
jgi:hypothetical protein